MHETLWRALAATALAALAACSSAEGPATGTGPELISPFLREIDGWQEIGTYRTEDPWNGSIINYIELKESNGNRVVMEVERDVGVARWHHWVSFNVLGAPGLAYLDYDTPYARSKETGREYWWGESNSDGRAMVLATHEPSQITGEIVDVDAFIYAMRLGMITNDGYNYVFHIGDDDGLAVGRSGWELGYAAGKDIAIFYGHGTPFRQSREPVYMELTRHVLDGGGTQLFIGDQMFAEADVFYDELVSYREMSSLFLSPDTLPFFVVLGHEVPIEGPDLIVDIYRALDEEHPIHGESGGLLEPYHTDQPFGRLQRVARYPLAGPLTDTLRMERIVSPAGIYVTFAWDKDILEVWRLPTAELLAGQVGVPEVVLPRTDLRTTWSSSASGFQSNLRAVRVSDSGVVYLWEKASESGTQLHRVSRVRQGALETLLSPEAWFAMCSGSEPARASHLHSVDVVGETVFLSASVPESAFQTDAEKAEFYRRDHRIEFMRYGR